MNKTTYTTTRFEIIKKFYFDIVERGCMVDFYLCMEDYDTLRINVFSVSKDTCPESEWENFIERNMEDSICTFFRQIENQNNYNDWVEMNRG